MVKKIIAVASSILMLFCIVPFAAFADVLDACPKCGERTYVQETGLTVDACGIGVTYNTKHCTSCRYSYYEWSLFGRTGYKEFESGIGDNLVADFISEWIFDNFGKDAKFTKFESGGGSTDGSGVGRRPDGYADDNGTPSISSDGGIIWQPTWDDVISLNQSGYYYSCFVFGFASAYNSTFYYSEKPGYTYFEGNIAYDKEKLNYAEKIEHGLYLHRESDNLLFVNSPYFNGSFVFQLPVRGSAYRLKTPSAYYKQLDYNFYYTTNTYNTSTTVTSQILLNSGMGSSVTAKRHDLYVYFPTFKIIPASDSDKPIIQNNITINNNTWNGNIYTDNSTNLTYIYPQYTTINEKNETVTNISNTPIIYNNETKQYYTYDQTTKNYYYITYNAPSPSPTPAPTENPGGDAGDTTGILAVLVEIRDNMIQGFLDIKAAFVAGFAELSANFTLAIENLNVNIQNTFNKKFPDQSTPETAQPTPTPSPEPTETPSPTDPPSPSPAPTGKPDSGGDTNNFWNIFVGSGSDDGTDGDHKGIFWALVSLILALIAFFTNLFAGVAYLFPFLPEGVVMTLNTCLFVVFLFVIIKFIMRSK